MNPTGLLLSDLGRENIAQGHSHSHPTSPWSTVHRLIRTKESEPHSLWDRMGVEAYQGQEGHLHLHRHPKSLSPQPAILQP